MIKELDYQTKAVDELVEKCAKLLQSGGERRKLVFKAPTGAGKTVMASLLLERLAAELPQLGRGEPAFVWIAPNQLHEQSCLSMRKFFSETMRLAPKFFEELDRSSDAWLKPDEILFVNWQSINKDTNVATREDERGASLYDISRRTREEHGAPIIAIIDEEHLFAGGKAATQSNEVLSRLRPRVEIRISATPVTVPDELVNVPRSDVVAAQMIKEGITINPRLPNDEGYGAEITLLRAALKKREELKAAYAREGTDINPLLLIQFPNDTSEKLSQEEETLRESLEKYLEALPGITTGNGRLAVWLSGEARNLEGIDKTDSIVDALIFKQAIAMGWDCPRAAVLLIFRDMKSVTFTMQTVGRILRMPEQRHYAEAALNRGYVYTNLARDRIEIVRDDIDYFKEPPIKARRRDGIDNVRLTSESASRPSQVGHNRLGSDFYRMLLDVTGEELLRRPVQLEFDFSAFEEEEVENVAV